MYTLALPNENQNVNSLCVFRIFLLRIQNTTQTENVEWIFTKKMEKKNENEN